MWVTDLGPSGRVGSGMEWKSAEGAEDIEVGNMDRYLLHSLGRALYSLECDGGGLDDLLFPRQSCAQGVGKSSVGRRGSAPPVDLAMLDLKIETESTLAFWASRVPHPIGDGPVSRSIADSARWLQVHIAVVDDAPWGEMAAQEIIAAARVVADVVNPSDDDDGAGESMPEFVSCRVAASWMRNSGISVNHSTIYRWAKRGKIRAAIDDGGMLTVSLSDVDGMCNVIAGRATPLGVS